MARFPSDESLHSAGARRFIVVGLALAAVFLVVAALVFTIELHLLG